MSVPRKVVSVSKNSAVLSDGRTVRLDLVGQVKPGSYVIVSADLAVEKISKKQAEAMGAMLS
jgi:hydrogenase maturation factor